MSEFNFKPEELFDREAVAKAINEKLKEDLVNSLYYKVNQMATEEVTKVLQTEIEGMVRDHKDVIIEGVKLALPEIAKAMATELTARAVKNLEGYSGKAVFEKLFGY